MSGAAFPPGVAALLLAFVVAGCGEEPRTNDFGATYQIVAELDGARAWAHFGPTGHSIPELDEDGELRILGVPRPLTDSGDSFFTLVDVPRLEAGQPYDYVLDLPWQDPVSVQLPMVQPLELITPPADAVIPIEDGLHLSWRSQPGGEDEVATLSLPGIDGSLAAGTRGGFAQQGDQGLVEVGDDEMTFPVAELQSWLVQVVVCCEYDATPTTGVAFPLEVEISMTRGYRIDIGSQFDDNGSMAVLDGEVARRTVTFTDPDGTVAASIAAEIEASKH